MRGSLGNERSQMLWRKEGPKLGGILPGHPWHMRRPRQRSPQRTQGATLLSALPGSGAKLLTGGRTWAQTMLGFREPVGPCMLGPHKRLSAKCGHQRARIFVPLHGWSLGKNPTPPLSLLHHFSSCQKGYRSWDVVKLVVQFEPNSHELSSSQAPKTHALASCR